MPLSDNHKIREILQVHLKSCKQKYILVMAHEMFTNIDDLKAAVRTANPINLQEKIDDYLVSKRLGLSVKYHNVISQITVWSEKNETLDFLISMLETNSRGSRDEHPIEAAFSELYKAFAFNIGDEFLFSYLIDTIVKLMKAEVGLLQIFAEGEVYSYSLGMKADDLLNISYRDLKIRDYLNTTRNYIFIENIEDDDKIKLDDRARGVIKTLIFFPIFNKGDLIAIIYLVNKSYSADITMFNETDLRLITTVSVQIGAIITNALLYKKSIEVKEYNEEILENIPAGVFIVSFESEVMFKNKYLRDLLTKMEFTDKQLLAQVSAIQNDEFLSKEIVIKLNENMVYITVSRIFLKLGNAQPISLFTVIDNTQEKEIEEQLRRSEKLATAGELMSTIAHEIKNPLTSIKGFADLLWQRLEDKEFITKFATVVSRELSRLNNIIERFLSFAKPQIGIMSTIELTEVIYEVAEIVSFSLNENHIFLDIQLDQEIKIYGNRELLIQVFMNIVLNSIQAFTEQIREKNYIRITDVIKDGNVAIVIEDNGRGIPKGDMDKIFNPFYTTKPKGSGLGLAISDRIVSEHKGSIKIESKEGEYTRLIVMFPVFEKK